MGRHSQPRSFCLPVSLSSPFRTYSEQVRQWGQYRLWMGPIPLQVLVLTFVTLGKWMILCSQVSSSIKRGWQRRWIHRLFDEHMGSADSRPCHMVDATLLHLAPAGGQVCTQKSLL